MPRGQRASCCTLVPFSRTHWCFCGDLMLRGRKSHRAPEHGRCPSLTGVPFCLRTDGPRFQASIRSMLLGIVDRKQGTLAPLLAHWCAGGKVPNCPNWNFYRGNGAQVLLHCDGEALFGNSRAKSSLFLGVFWWSCLLVDLLTVVGLARDDMPHCTVPGLEEDCTNITYRWQSWVAATQPTCGGR